MSAEDEALPDVTLAVRWHYFVSFAHLGGFGNCTLWLSAAVADCAAVGRMERSIAESRSYLSVTVLSFQLIGLGDESDAI